MRGMSIIAEVLLHLNIGERIKGLREAHNMSVKELAKQMYIGTYALRMIELGGREITAYNYLRLHEIFGVSLHYIITGKQLEEKPVRSGNTLWLRHGEGFPQGSSFSIKSKYCSCGFYFL